MTQINNGQSGTTIKRRSFLAGSAALATTMATSGRTMARPRSPRFLLRSSWQVVNIGDIAHTPGVLALIERHIPEAEVVLWASGDLSPEVAAMEHKRFPRLKIVKGSIGTSGKASNADLQSAIDWADFLLHGSGPSLVAAKDVAAFVEHTKKPFGVYGITHGSFVEGVTKQLLAQAKFTFFRDSVSLQRAKDEGVACPILGFAPDGAFACDLRDDASAMRLLDKFQLKPGKFMCCLSRLRNTPYWTIPGSKRPFDAKKQARNEEMKEHDHQPIRQAIVEVVRNTDLKVLLCPEDMTQMTVGKELLLDKLPEDVRSRVVWKPEFWLTDEALSVYRQSAGLFGSEMHSPIMAVGNGIPAIVCRFEEQTSKGWMWKDIGLGEWLFDLDQERDCQKVPSVVKQLAQDLPAARQKTAAARDRVLQLQAETMKIVRECIR
ncbi:MAG: polysaccharide pyruvyl transferase family protein [Pirellulales bacterium]